MDSTKSRDQPIDQQILLEVPGPVTEVLRQIRPLINFLWNSHIDEIPSIVAFAGNITHIVQDFGIPYIFDPPKVQQDKHFQEFLRGEIHCQNFINQDLTFLQLPILYVTQPKDSILPEEITTEVPSIAHQESDSNKEQKANSSPVSSVEVLYNRNGSNNRTAPIQPVEPVVGLTQKEQDRREEDPGLPLDEFLGLIPCEQHITTPL